MKFKLFIIAFMLLTFSAWAQKDTTYSHNKGKIEIGGGIGYSMLPQINSTFSTLWTGNATGPTITSRSPFWIVSIAYGITKKTNIGLIYSYSNANIVDYAYGTPVYGSEQFATRQTIDIKYTFNFVSHENLVLYTGAYLGGGFWTDKMLDSSYNGWGQLALNHSSQNLVSAQLFFGAKLFPSDFLGFNFEIGIGDYLGKAGLVFVF